MNPIDVNRLATAIQSTSVLPSSADWQKVMEAIIKGMPDMWNAAGKQKPKQED